MDYYFKPRDSNNGVMLYLPRNCNSMVHSNLDRLSIWGKPTSFEFRKGLHLIGWEFGYFESKEAIEILDSYGFDYNELRN